jgi:hypothetical protein
MLGNFFAIRLQGTDLYLANYRNSFTYYEPTNEWNKHKVGPRLFFTEIAAKASLRNWKMGVWCNEGEEGLVVSSRHHRKHMNMEIIPVQLMLITPQDGESNERSNEGSYV